MRLVLSLEEAELSIQDGFIIRQYRIVPTGWLCSKDMQLFVKDGVICVYS